MSYQVLARKWRPATFEQVVGQSHVLHALTNALSQNRLHHAYLFTGTRGVGKTSLARLFAKGLNCEQGVTASPCGQCASCVEIAQGRFVDLIEVDAASRTKVDDTRELLDNVQYRPTRGRFKVYLIDEVHMLSRSSFNALLKTLEEPPEHVKFLLATTDPQRLPVTVLSRCLQFNLKSLTLDEICVQLGHILAREQVGYDDGAVKLLAKAANGSMRDALSLTDQAIAFGAGQVRLDQVQTMLGTIDEHHVIVLLKALCDGDVDKLLTVTGEVLSFGADPHEVLRSLLELLHQITLTQFAPSAAQLSQYAEQIKAFAKQLRSEQVQLYYQLLLNGRQDLPHAPDPKSGLEMALLRAVAFVPEAPVQRWMGEVGSEIVLPELSKLEEVSPTPVKSVAPAPEAESKLAPVLEAVSEATSKPAPQAEPAIDNSQEAEKASQVEAEAEAVASATEANAAEKASQNEKVIAEACASDDDADDDESASDLFAEQQLILSQAESQGHNQGQNRAPSSQETSLESSQPETSLENKSPEDKGLEDKGSVSQSPVSEALVEPQAAASQVEVPLSAVTAPSDEVTQASEIETPAESVEQAASSAEQLGSAAEENGSFYDDLYFSADEDESGDPSDYEAYLAYQQGQDSQASGEISAQEASTPTDNTTQVDSTIQANGTAQASSAPIIENAPVGGVSSDAASADEESTPKLLEDDLLDAVLNARQNLLSDLKQDAAKEDAAKESASKKPLVGVKTPGTSQDQADSDEQAGESQLGAQPYVPPKRPSQAALSEETALSDKSALSGEATALSDKSALSDKAVLSGEETALSGEEDLSAQTNETEPPSQSVTHTQNSQATENSVAYLNDEDRPPWVSPEASNQEMVAPGDEAPHQVKSNHAPVQDVAGQASVQESSPVAEHASRVQAIENQGSVESTATDNPSTVQGAEQVVEPVSQVAQAAQMALVTDEITGHDTDLKWYRLMSALEIGGRVRQLAVNAVCKAFSEPLPLVLKPNQKHLAAPGAISQLEDALSKALGGSCQVEFSVGVEPERETPLEIRQRFHRELLEQAHQGLLQDENIRWLTQMMQAEMEPDSLTYLPELLGKRGQTIALIDKSNFVTAD
ncbi:DNA polymerase III subunit gamma/tau [Shewanella sp. cp20]|uniref:DNA polymerase III subunit gamma/tau n=1 Tax=Shewanella sp. cp20 TaxID=1521167 RepID=UPI0005A2BED4|nr:DNA polymerase III subunit gamma/tau [Shewanella sp. cp20]KIO35618.1 hypothetical protein DB48_15130 [Shewanella sp. cp20]